jgi:hypothetical protein
VYPASSDNSRQVFTGHKKLDFIAENHTSTIGFIGLSQNSGRIIVVEPQAYGPVCLLERYILAHTNNVDLVTVNDSLLSKE